jgi:hypothetical protein
MWPASARRSLPLLRDQKRSEAPPRWISAPQLLLTTIYMVKPPIIGQLSSGMVLVALLAILGSVMVAAELPDIRGEADRSFEHITIEGVTYSNVTLFTQTATDVILKHDQGLTGLKVANLDNPTLRRLGYRVEEAEPDPALADRYGLGYFSSFFDSDDLQQWSMLTLIGLVVLTVGFYIYTSYLFWLICVKTEITPGILVWLPFFQVFPLLRAARMSSLWVVALVLVTVGSGFVSARLPDYALWSDIFSAVAMLSLWSVWAVRICRVRHKGIITAILLLLPGMNYLALLYLAGSK